MGVALLCAGGVAWGAPVETNPLNYNPQVRKAYEDFYNLDYAAAVAGFERIQQEHPGNPQAAAYLLNAVVFQELYRLDLLDTTFYATDGFLSGKHAVEDDPAVHARVVDLTNEVVQEADAELEKDPNDVNAAQSPSARAARKPKAPVH